MKDSQSSLVLFAELERPDQIENREQFVTTLGVALDEIENLFLSEWFAPLTRVRGITELAAVLQSPVHAFDIGVSLNLALWPRRFNFALLSGKLDVGLGSGNAAMMDGPVIERAAAMLARAKDDDLPWVIDLGEEIQAAAALSESCAVMHGLIMSNWSPVRLDVVRVFRACGKQAEVARRLSISQQAVSQSLSRAHIRELNEVERAIRDWLASLAR